MKQSADQNTKKRSYQQAERTGKLAELLICLIYMCRGFWPVSWRHRTIYGELDLVMRRGQHLRFLEVKYRKSGISADSPISHQQMKRLQNAGLACYAFQKELGLACHTLQKSSDRIGLLDGSKNQLTLKRKK